MKTKIVYVVTSDQTDTYLEQFVISAYSVRKHNPDVFIEFVTDNVTMQILRGERAYACKYFDKITAIDIPEEEEYTKRQRSRYLKTSLRNHISGDYLFVDTDTIILDKLSLIEEFPNDICAVREYNREAFFTTSDWGMTRFADKVGLTSELIGEPYFNSGVMYVKDTPAAHALYRRWHECWKQTRAKGVANDQTPLCWANKLEGHVIQHVEDIWNCMFRGVGKQYLPQAKIVHYLAESGDCNYLISRKSVLMTVKAYGGIAPFIEDLVDNATLFLINNSDVVSLSKIRRISCHPRFCQILENLSNLYIKIHSTFSKRK